MDTYLFPIRLAVERQQVVEKHWQTLHDPTVDRADFISRLAAGASFSTVLLALTAHAYQAGESQLLRDLYTSGILDRSDQYALLAAIRDRGDWLDYDVLLRLDPPEPADLLRAADQRELGDELTPLRIYFENTTPTQANLLAAITFILEDESNTPVGVAKLNLLLPLYQDEQKLRRLLPALRRREEWSYHTALVANGVKLVGPPAIRALAAPEGAVAWTLLRNTTNWPDLPHRAVLELQRRERTYHLALEAALGRNLAGYVFRGL